jgi:hypothetical protein
VPAGLYRPRLGARGGVSLGLGDTGVRVT